jgi:hypothetical protein
MVSNESTEVTVVVPSNDLTEEEISNRRAERAELCLWQLLLAAKQQTDPATWLNLGLLEAEAYLEAVHDGTRHPLITAHEQRAATRRHSHPPPPANEMLARRLVVLALIALRRAGARKETACRRVNAELKRVPLFAQAPSAGALDHWERRLSPPLTPADEILLARGLTRCGIGDLGSLAAYFLGMAHVAFNPSAVAVRQP